MFNINDHFHNKRTRARSLCGVQAYFHVQQKASVRRAVTEEDLRRSIIAPQCVNMGSTRFPVYGMNVGILTVQFDKTGKPFLHPLGDRDEYGAMVFMS